MFTSKPTQVKVKNPKTHFLYTDMCSGTKKFFFSNIKTTRIFFSLRHPPNCIWTLWGGVN